MPVQRSTQRGFEKTEAALKAIRAVKSLDAIRARNNPADDAIDPGYTQTGQILQWLSTHPRDITQLFGADTAPAMTADMYKDRLHWAASTLQRLEKEFDAHELEYRRLGLAYHETPSFLRDPAANPPNTLAQGLSPTDLRIRSAVPILPAINPTILQTLKDIFDSDRPRTTHDFFTNWHTTQHRLTDIKDLLNTDYSSYSRGLLRAMVRRVDADLDSVADELLTTITAQMDSVSHNVSEVTSRRGLGEGASLSQPSSVEGSAYRRWVSSFPEVVGGEVRVDVAERVLRMGGAEKSMGWEDGYLSWKEEERKAEAGGLGWEWEV
ncbi:hypothetical protein SLS60_003683 [Paraconiothyrium brasiliense]|uniref:Uncharacterized protein n=1 Tax=Paraconiothyrium brasiliense TaxID=300254 RepID=A0ABR3RPD6_9PLEO